MVTGSPSVAIRIYTMEEISEIERSLVETDGDVGLQHFCDSFEHSMVFFVLARGEDQRDQLGRREPFVNAAQQASLISRNNDRHEENRDAVKVNFNEK